MVDCSETLRTLREAKHLTQAQVAQKIGVSKAMVSAYETATKVPSIEVLVRLSRLFGVTVDYLVCVDARKYIDVSALDDESAAVIATLVSKMRPAEGEREE